MLCIVYSSILTRNRALVLAARENGSSHILVWRPSPRTSLSRRCMNSELVELLDKEGEEGGEDADEVDEDAEDIEKEDEGDGDTFEGGGDEEGRMKELYGEGVKEEERRWRNGVQGGSGKLFSCIIMNSSSSSASDFFLTSSSTNNWCKVSTRWFCPIFGRTLW